MDICYPDMGPDVWFQVAVEDILVVQYHNRLQELSSDPFGLDLDLCRVRFQILPEVAVLDVFHCDVDVVGVFEPALQRHTSRALMCR